MVWVPFPEKWTVLNYVINNYDCLNNLIVRMEGVELHDQAQILHF